MPGCAFICGRLLIACCAMVHLIADAVSFEFDEEPEFGEVMSNVTASLGRDAVFTCNVNNLNEYKVGWIKADTKAIQAIGTTIVTHNPRISVEQSGASTSWKLIIRGVRREDAGAYMCQINAEPMKYQTAYLDITEAPDIDDRATPSEVHVMELAPLRITCLASGRPAPKISWKREDGIEIRNDTCKDIRHKTHTTNSMGHLCINKVTRNHMATYLCIASNGVLPIMSKRIHLIVLFAPIVKAEKQMVASPYGTQVVLECLVQASPLAINLWYKDGEMLVSQENYAQREQRESPYTVRMLLTIRHFHSKDDGRYRCLSKNTYGESDSTIRLYELPRMSRDITQSARQLVPDTKTTIEYPISSITQDYPSDLSSQHKSTANSIGLSIYCVSIFFLSWF